MRLLLHTIALEPARWTPQRVHRPLTELLPEIARAGFKDLEIYEPHLALAPDEPAMPGLLACHGLAPVMLSSYLDVSPATNPDSLFESQAEALLVRVRRFGFGKVRLFPGRALGAPAALESSLQALARRLRRLADAAPEVEFLLETHDGGIADDPWAMVSLVEYCERPNAGLLFQPTVFEATAASAQFAAQKQYIRHFHLQNRDAELNFATLADGVIQWPEFLSALPVDATLEFVPSGICAPDQFNLAATLAEAIAEAEYAASLAIHARAAGR